MDHIEYQGKRVDETEALMKTITEDSAIIVLVVSTQMIVPSENRTLHPAGERTVRSLHVQPPTKPAPVLTLLAERSPSGVMNGESDSEVDELPHSAASTLRVLTAKRNRLSNRFSRCFPESEILEPYEMIPEESTELMEPSDSDESMELANSDSSSSEPEGSQRMHLDTTVETSDEKKEPDSCVPDGMELQSIPAEDRIKGVHVRDTLKQIVQNYGTLRGETLHAECFRLVIRDTEKEKQWKPKASIFKIEEEENKEKLKMKRMIKQLLDDPSNDERGFQKWA